MKDFFWDVFEKSGSIEALMAYKEFYEFNLNQEKCKTSEYILPYSV